MSRLPKVRATNGQRVKYTIDGEQAVGVLVDIEAFARFSEIEKELDTLRLVVERYAKAIGRADTASTYADKVSAARAVRTLRMNLFAAARVGGAA